MVETNAGTMAGKGRELAELPGRRKKRKPTEELHGWRAREDVQRVVGVTEDRLGRPLKGAAGRRRNMFSLASCATSPETNTLFNTVLIESLIHRPARFGLKVATFGDLN